MGFKLKCPQCELKFSYKPTEDWPKRCRAIQSNGKKGCGFDMSLPDEEEGVISMPAFLSARTAATDGVARQIMDGSEFRVEAAAQMAGVDKSEMSSLKITNLNDRNDTETSAITVSNPVTAFMAQNKVGGFQGANGSQYAGAVASGPHPNAGARTLMGLQQTMGGRSGRVDK